MIVFIRLHANNLRCGARCLVISGVKSTSYQEAMPLLCVISITGWQYRACPVTAFKIACPSSAGMANTYTGENS